MPAQYKTKSAYFIMRMEYIPIVKEMYDNNCTAEEAYQLILKEMI